jgi:hypothetical protein
MRPSRFLPRRISLRLALGLVATVASGMGWIAYRVRVQEQGIELIRQHGGMYYYDFEDRTNYPRAPRSWVPRWLIQSLGMDYFHHVTWVRIEDPRFDDEDLGRLTACLPHIESLGIIGTSITDAGLARLRGNRWLKGLFLTSNRITDAGIDRLSPETMPVLELLDVRGTGVGATKVAAVEVIFEARESAARVAHPTVRVSEHMVLAGGAPPPFLGPDPRGAYEKGLSANQAGPQNPD